MCTLTLAPLRAGHTVQHPPTVTKLVGRPRPSLLPYLPPEVLRQRQKPKRSADTFAFGVLMWECYTGAVLDEV